MAHFPDFYSVDENKNYFPNYPIAAKWEIQRGHREGKTYRALLDRLEMADVCWRPYEEHREIQKFDEIFWYSGWIMCGVDKMYRHLPERVKRQYGYVQDIPRPSTDVLSMQDTHIVQAFLDFRFHTIKGDSWGQPTGDMPWLYEDKYMIWYRQVSHPQILPPIRGSPLRPANEEHIIAHQRKQHQEIGLPDTFDMVNGVIFQADDYLGHEGMRNEQLSTALRDVGERLAPIMTRRRRRPRRQQEQEQE